MKKKDTKLKIFTYYLSNSTMNFIEGTLKFNIRDYHYIFVYVRKVMESTGFAPLL